MQLNLSGHHVELTDAIRSAANEKFGKIASHYPRVDSIDVNFTVERHEQKVEATTLYQGVSVSVNASKDDLYAAISDAVKKLDSALGSRKGAKKANLHEKPILTPVETETEIETE